ncbi:MAG: indolepyruvate ferredoxin oxidoreductase subunit alpha [Candidatus Bathyarchaeia archaeon]
MSHPVALDKPGERVLLMGNEAIARGAIEGGATVATGYPGTPSSEIGNTLARVANDVGIHFEWSGNEKVAMEVAYGASMCGQRAMVSMKHVGLNVALDMLNPISLRGVGGGLVIVSTDDPSQHSSRTEQDTRWLAKLNDVPVIEPCTPQEAKDYTRYAFELSEEVKLPVILRTVTRLSHMRSDVELGMMDLECRRAEFDWEGFSYRVSGFEKLFRRHGERRDKLDKTREIFESLKINQVNSNGRARVGVIGVGFSYSYVLDALRLLDAEDEVTSVKLATSHPLPEGLISKVIEPLDRVLICEEVTPFVEVHLKALAKDVNPDLEILGRLTGDIPRVGELSHEIVDSVIAELLGRRIPMRERAELEEASEEILFDRMLTLCAGCPHRATLYALKKAVSEVKGDPNSVVINGDIGCYGLAHAPPLEFEDTYFCMGASIGVSQGMAQVGVDSIAWIGDGTFFHAGIPGLINAVHNDAPIKIVVADNETIAMTGFQTNPESGRTATGKKTKKIMIEDLARASGVEHVEVVDSYDLESAEEAFIRMLEHDGTAMVISRRLCATEAIREMRPQRPTPYTIDQATCVGCRICLNEFGCPALIWDEELGKAKIDQTLCMGCGVCAQICPVEAIERGG